MNNSLNLEHSSREEFYTEVLRNFDMVCFKFGHSMGFAYYLRPELNRFKHASAIKHAMVYLLKDFGWRNKHIAEYTGLTEEYVRTAVKRRASRESFLTNTLLNHTVNRMTDRDELEADAKRLVRKLIDDVSDMRMQLDTRMREIQTLEAKIKDLFH